MATKSRHEWFINNEEYSKDDLISRYKLRFINMLVRLFKYDNLPKTIPQKDLEIILLSNGSATVTKVNGELYAFRGQLGGEPNPYYLPTLSIVSNPALNYSKSLVIDKDCVVISNDSLRVGVIPLINDVCLLLAECDLTFRSIVINSRLPNIITAPDSQTYLDVQTLIDKVVEGNYLFSVIDNNLFKEMKSLPFNTYTDGIKIIIELKQYILGTFYQEIGLPASFNMKREAINEAEASMSDFLLLPYVDDMLEHRKEAIDKINNMFGTNITIELDSSWKRFRKGLDLTEKIIEAEISSLNNPSEEVNNDEQSN